MDRKDDFCEQFNIEKHKINKKSKNALKDNFKQIVIFFHTIHFKISVLCHLKKSFENSC